MSEARQFWRLLRLQLRMRLGLSLLKADKKRKAKIIGLGALILLAVVSVLSLYILLLYLLVGPAIQAGLGAVMMGAVFLIIMMMSLVFGTILMLTLVFQARDAELYAALPLSPRAVFLSKFGLVYLSELLIALGLAVPAIVMYAVYGGLSVGLILGLVLVVPLLPLIPLCIACLLAFGLSRLTGLTRRREMWTVIGMFLLIVAMVFLQMGIQRLTQSAFELNESSTLLDLNRDLLKNLTGAFPPAMWAAALLALPLAEAIPQLLLFWAVCAAALFLSAWLAGRGYYRVALQSLETPKREGKGYRAGQVKAASPLKTLFFREWKILIRTPVYLLNSVSMIVLFPVLILIMPLMNAGGTDILSDLLEQGVAAAGPFLPLMISAGLFAFVCLVNTAASTAISREGRNFWIMRAIPVPMRTQLRAKFLCPVSIMALSVLVMGGCLMGALGFGLDVILPAVLIGLCAVWPTTAAAMLPDIIRPKLSWMTEAAAMKQNANSMIGMLTSLAALVPAGIAAWLLYTPLDGEVWLYSAILIGVLLASGVVLDGVMMSLAKSRLETRDV